MAIGHQGFGPRGFNELLTALTDAHKRLAARIAPKVYAYGFLRA